jgi:hypothetical protein
MITPEEVGGFVAALGTIGLALKKAGLVSFGKQNGNGNGANLKQKPEPKTEHRMSDDYAKVMQELSNTQIRQGFIIEAHSKRLDDGKVDIDEIKKSISKIEVGIGVLTDRSIRRREIPGGP